MFSYCVIHEAWDCIECQKAAIEAMPPGARLFLTQSEMKKLPDDNSRKCLHRGTRLSVAPCCGQMFACNLHKGKKCSPTGIAKEPFLSCETCGDFVATEYEQYPNSKPSIVTAEPPADK